MEEEKLQATKLKGIPSTYQVVKYRERNREEFRRRKTFPIKCQAVYIPHLLQHSPSVQQTMTVLLVPSLVPFLLVIALGSCLSDRMHLPLPQPIPSGAHDTAWPIRPRVAGPGTVHNLGCSV